MTVTVFDASLKLVEIYMKYVLNNSDKTQYTWYLRIALIDAWSKSKKDECNDGSSKQISSWCKEVVEGNNLLRNDPSTKSTLRDRAIKARTGALTF